MQQVAVGFPYFLLADERMDASEEEEEVRQRRKLNLLPGEQLKERINMAAVAGGQLSPLAEPPKLMTNHRRNLLPLERGHFLTPPTYRSCVRISSSPSP